MSMTVQHTVGITKGDPRRIGTDKNGQPTFRAQYHWICECGEFGEDGDAIYAQTTGLRHQGGQAATVRPPTAPRDPNSPIVHLTLECGHSRADRTEHPADYQRLQEGFCETCWKWQPITSSRIERRR